MRVQRRWYLFVVTLNERILEVAKSHVGTMETTGARHNPKILSWFKVAGAPWIDTDEAAWCSAFACGVAAEANAYNPRTVRAKEWLAVPKNGGGEKVEAKDLLPGDVVVTTRGPGLFHVTFFSHFAENGALMCVGGNQANKVCLRGYGALTLVGAVRLRAAYLDDRL